MLGFDDLELVKNGELVEIMRITGGDIVMVDYPIFALKVIIEHCESCEECDSTDGFNIKIVDQNHDIWFVHGKRRDNDDKQEKC